jgi:glycosyltransferase involved in cell wall biosynthesis
MRVLVVTTVHNPEDSRIRARQIPAMLGAGWQVTYAAAFSGWDSPRAPVDGLTTVDLPQASGRRRMKAYAAARRLLRERGPEHDVILLHDPELLLAVRGLEGLPPVIWDVHEDTAGSVSLKSWLPTWARGATADVVRRLEAWAEENVHMLLAEPSYQSRFRTRHLVVPNTVRVPSEIVPPGDSEVVYIGSITEMRGARDLIRIGQILQDRTGGAVRLRLIGTADLETEHYLRIAQDSGALRWDGFLPSEEALQALRGALAGLSLLHDTPNYRISMPTKVLEYMAHGVPVITTPLPLVTELVETAGCGLVVPFQDAAGAAQAILTLRDHPEQRRRMAESGHAVARWQFDWNVQSASFLAEIARIAQEARSPGAA